MRYFTLAELGLDDYKDPQPSDAVEPSYPERPFGWSLRAAIACLIDEYGISPRRLTTSIRIALDKPRRDARRRDVVPEAAVQVALADASGGRLRDVDWSGTRCFEVVADVVEHRWWTHHRKRGKHWYQDVPAAIEDLRLDAVGGRYRWEFLREAGRLFGQALLLRYVAASGTGTFTPMTGLESTVLRLERYRHYVSQGFADGITYHSLGEWFLGPVSALARLDEQTTGASFWTVHEREPLASVLTTSPNTREMAWLQILDALTRSANRDAPASEAINNIGNLMWRYATERRGKRTDDLLRWAVLTQLDEAIAVIRGVMAPDPQRGAPGPALPTTKTRSRKDHP